MSSKYDQLTGRPTGERRTSPWLRSMRGEREELRHKKLRLTAIEAVVVTSVITAVISFEIFFFFAPISLQGKAGLG